jgi:hypothetical protein
MSIAPCPASFVPTLSPQGNETIAPIQVANLLPRRQAFPLKEEKLKLEVGGPRWATNKKQTSDLRIAK